MKRSVLTLFLLAGTLFPTLLRAQDNPSHVYNWPELHSLKAEVHENGDVVLTENEKPLGKVYTAIYTGPWRNGLGWVRELLFSPGDDGDLKKGFNASASGGVILLKSTVERLPTGLHIHYHLVPQDDIQVSSVQSRIQLPFDEHLGDAFQLNQNTGNVEDGFATGVESSQSLTLGPCHALGDQVMHLTVKGIALWFMDERSWKKNIVVAGKNGGLHWEHLKKAPSMDSSRHFLLIGMDIKQPPLPYQWSAGEANDFDFTLTFENGPGVGADRPGPTPGFMDNPSLSKTMPPTPTPTPVRESSTRPTVGPASRQGWSEPTATPTLRRGSGPPTLVPWTVPSPTPTGVRHATITPLPVAVQTPPPDWFLLLDKEHPVYFSDPPANIDVTFADGPGRYRVEVVDGRGNYLETLFDRKVVVESDLWLDWDGQDGKGDIVPWGRYFVILYKDGKAIKSIPIVRSKTNP